MTIKKVVTSAALVVALLAQGGNALASTEEAASGPSATDTSTSIPSTKNTVRNSEFHAEMRAWVNGRVAAMHDYRVAIAAASTTLNSALDSATSKEGRKSAMAAFKSAREVAKSALDSALTALGDRPVRPTR